MHFEILVCSCEFFSTILKVTESQIQTNEIQERPWKIQVFEYV